MPILTRQPRNVRNLCVILALHIKWLCVIYFESKGTNLYRKKYTRKFHVLIAQMRDLANRFLVWDDAGAQKRESIKTKTEPLNNIYLLKTIDIQNPLVHDIIEPILIRLKTHKPV